MIDNVKNVLGDDPLRLSSSPLYVDPTWNIRTGHFDTKPNALKSQDVSEMREQMIQAGRKFEAYFVSYLLKVMRETVPEGAIADKQGPYFYSFYDEEIGNRAVEAGGIGIAKMVQEYADRFFSASTRERSSSIG